MNITLIHEELHNYLADSPKKLSEDALDMASPDCLKGSDGKPIFKNPIDKLSSYDMLRFGRFFHLDFHRTLVLVLKAQWEHFLRETLQTTDVYALKDVEQARNYSVSFTLGLLNQADEQSLYHAFEASEHFASKAGYVAPQFSLLVQQMIIHYMHLFGTASAELDDFIERETKEQHLLSEVSSEEQEALWLKKLQWTEMETRQGNILFRLVLLRLQHNKIEQEWHRVFGEVFFQLKELEIERDMLVKKIEFKTFQAELSIEAVDLMLKEQEENYKRELAYDNLVGDLQGSLPWQDKHVVADKKEIEQETKEFKAVLCKIRGLTHPDNTTWEKFTPAQLDKLGEYYQRAVESDPNLGVMGNKHFAEVLKEVETFYEHVGLDIEVGRVIRGNTLQEKLQWLDVRISYLDEEIKNINAEIFHLSKDRHILEKLESMASPERKTQTRDYLESNREALAEEVKRLTQEYQELFNFQKA